MSSIAAGDFKSQVLGATDIVALIGQSVPLKKRGRDYLGLCPFHQEKTPSFHVNPARQFFYCFGCKAKGNAIDFVIQRDRVEFIDALKSLGAAAGLEMPRSGASKQKDGERQTMLDANSAAGAFFAGLLNTGQQGSAARDYLRQRGISDESIKRFQIGVAPDAWDGLLRGPVGRKFSPQLLAAAGLVKARENNGGFYDTFRNRLMFPIRDENGRVIAFGGRVMPGSQDPAKYLNSPETPLFSKGRCVFGIDLAKQAMVEKRTVAVVEGYTDVVMAHQHGVNHVVSILGTAMTESHLTILRRFADKVVLLFDADNAGDLAVDRVVELFLTQPIEMAIASLPQGVDPDEFLIAHGAAGFEKVLSDATDVLSHKWRQLARRHAAEAGDLTGQQKAVEAYLELLADARGTGPVDALRWGAALSRVSRLTDMPIDELFRRFRMKRPATAKRGAAPSNAVGMNGGEGAGVPPAPRRRPAARDVAERQLLGILLLEPRRWQKVQTLVGVEDFTDPTRRGLAEAYWSHQRDEGEPVFHEFLGFLSSPALAELAVELVEETERFVAADAPPPAADAAPPKRTARVREEGPGAVDVTLASALEYIAHQRQATEQQKLVARVRRVGDPALGRHEPLAPATEPGSEPDVESIALAAQHADVPAADEGSGDRDEVSLLKEFMKKNHSTDLHRPGPVRRLRT